MIENFLKNDEVSKSVTNSMAIESLSIKGFRKKREKNRNLPPICTISHVVNCV